MTQLGVVTTLPNTKHIVTFARVAESVGFDRIGLADTAPRLYHAVYPAVTACLTATERLFVGPYATNPITRHWSVHAATARGLEELTPGRFFIGMATGDGAVHSVGLKPASLAYFESYVMEMRQLMPSTTNIHMVFSGSKGAEVAGRLGTELTLGTGMDVGALRELARRARAARSAAGVTSPLRIWAMVPVHLVPLESEVPAMREHVRSMANGGARFAFDFSFEGKNVPEPYRPILRDRLARYDFGYHAKGGDNPNAHLFDDHPEIQDYLVDRMYLVGTPQQCARHLESLIREAELDGVWLPVMPSDRGSAAHIAALCAVADAFGHLAS